MLYFVWSKWISTKYWLYLCMCTCFHGYRLLRAIFFIILKCKVHWLFFVPRWPGFWLKKYAPCWIHIRQRWISRLSLNSETPPTGTRSLSKDFILVWSYGEFCLIPQETINFSFYVCPSCLLGRISINCTSFCSMFTYNLIQFILKLDDSIQREFSDKAWLVRCVLDPLFFFTQQAPGYLWCFTPGLCHWCQFLTYSRWSFFGPQDNILK